MAYLISDLGAAGVPLFKCWVRKEFTNGHQDYHGEYIHAIVTAVNTMPDRCLSFQVIFTGCEADDGSQENVHGGAMWARMPLPALVGDIELEEWPDRMPTHLAQPWDCPSHYHSVVMFSRCQPSPWLCKIDGEFYKSRYLFTVDYTESQVADDPAQHKQSHVMILTEGQWKGNVVALPNNRVRVTSPAYWITGEGAPDFRPSQYIHCAEQDDSYTDPEVTFNNLYKDEDNVEKTPVRKKG